MTGKNYNAKEKFVEKSLASQGNDDHFDFNDIGYMARMLIQTTIPHSKPKENTFTRRNGQYSLTIIGDPDYGLPYGSIPRVFLSWLCTEVVKTKSREISLGNSLSEFMAKLGLMPTGGRWGSVTRLKNQIKRLATCSIRFKYDTEERHSFKKLDPIEEADLLWTWTSEDSKQGALFESRLRVGENFYAELIEHPVPYRLEALKLLTKSPLAIDIYLWLTYRNSYLRKETRIPWDLLQFQFGAGYPITPQGKRDFKKKFIETLRKIAILYPEACKLKTTEEYLVLMPANPHVPKNSTCG